MSLDTQQGVDSYVTGLLGDPNPFKAAARS